MSFSFTVAIVSSLLSFAQLFNFVNICYILKENILHYEESQYVELEYKNHPETEKLRQE